MLLLLLRKEGLLEGPRSRIDWPKLLLLFVIVSSVHMFSSHVPAKCKANSNQRCLLKKTMEKLRKCYYAMVPLRMLEQEDFNFLLTEEGFEVQKLLFDRLFNCQHAKLFSVGQKYKKNFLKRVINYMEAAGMEVLEEFYTEYLALLEANGDDEFCHKTYFIDSSEHFIIIKEATQMLSSGTTGLVSWQAAFAMCEWVYSNLSCFEERNILELGSGLGLLGMFICKMCNPRSYIFTDYHEKVLKLLEENIKLNDLYSLTKSHQLEDDLTRELCHRVDSLKGTTNDGFQIEIESTYETDLRGSCAYVDGSSEGCHCCRSIRGNKPDISYIKLDWQNSVFPDVVDQQHTDVIVGTDLVFDSLIIPSLVSVLSQVLRKSSNTKAFIATTIRNEDTHKCFRKHLDDAGLNCKELEHGHQNLFIYDRSIRVEILEIFFNS